jgi:YhcH/YjgK/YiaL family protein
VILDTLENLERYRGLDPHLDRGLEELRAFRSGKPGFPLEDGRHGLAGAELYASISSYLSQAPEAKLFEAHRRYLDVQVVFEGRETLYWAPLGRLRLEKEYSASEDIAFYSLGAGGLGQGLVLEPGLFVVLFPQDGHKPGCHPAGGQPQAVRKLVLKVRLG